MGCSQRLAMVVWLMSRTGVARNFFFFWGGGGYKFLLRNTKSYTLTSLAAISAQNNFQVLILGVFTDIYRYTAVATTVMSRRGVELDRFIWHAGDKVGSGVRRLLGLLCSCA